MRFDLFRWMLSYWATSRGLVSVCATIGVLRSITRFILDNVSADSRCDYDDEVIQYGVLNYRTGNLDNGLDPRGWYDFD